MMQPDWHPADIIAGLRKREHRWLRFPAGPGWRLPRWQMR